MRSGVDPEQIVRLGHRAEPAPLREQHLAEVNKPSVSRRWPIRKALLAAALEGLLEGVATRTSDTGPLRGDRLGLLVRLTDFIGEPTRHTRLIRGQSVSALVGAAIHRAMLERGAFANRCLRALIDLVLFGVIPRE